MRILQTLINSMLITITLFLLLGLVAGQPHGRQHHPQDFDVRAPDNTGTATPIPSSVSNPTLTFGLAVPCTGTTCAVAPSSILDPSCDNSYGDISGKDNWGTKYNIVCDIDFPGQDIYPFILSESFDQCLNHCVDYNQIHIDSKCVGAVFSPSRINSSDDCYLKSSLNDAQPASIHLVGATVISTTARRSSVSTSIVASSKYTGSATVSVSTILTTFLSATIQEQSTSSVQLEIPTVQDSTLLGSSSNNPTKQYVRHPFMPVVKLSSTPLVPGIDFDLINNYSISGDTGSWTLESYHASNHSMADMSVEPHLSRDGGKGGTINGTHIFIFCDTATFDGGGMIDFVSSSVATDVDMNGLQGKSLTLVDNLGEWQDDVGRMRGFAPMTIGEQSFNKELSGQGYRYAVWPESSLIPLNKTHALLYASLVYDEVDMSTQSANFSTIGNSLLVISVDPKFGPYADRVVQQLFKEGQITYGSLGGIRSWGQSGLGGMDGDIYLFGQVSKGIFVAKTSPTSYSDLSTYLFWDGKQWSDHAPSQENSDALLLAEPVMDFDLIYAPAYNTFLMIYLTPNADNTFYLRVVRPGTNTGILPPYEHGGDVNYVETILRGAWSKEHILYQATAPPMGYIYAGGLHAGYFGDDDITNGGYKGLLSWTEHTGEDASSPNSGYAHKTVVVTFK